MEILPNTVIKVLTECPLDNTYEHTLYFASRTAQTTYFNTLVKYTFSEQTYQRVQRGRMRVNRKAEDLYDCNYLMFQNTAFGTKWFYAFIKGVEYVNNTTSEIEFEIDVMQTWYFDYEVKACFVEREHSVTDNFGDNLVPEGLELGDYVVADNYKSGLFNSGYDWVVVASFDEDGEDAVGGLIQGVYSGLKFNFFNSAEEVNTFLETYPEKADGIVEIIQIPHFLYQDYIAQDLPVGHFIQGEDMPSSFGGYTPKNKKLLTYPYNFLYVSNNDGQTAEFHYEYFNTDDNAPEFMLTATLNTSPVFSLCPSNYKGVSWALGNTQNYDERIVMTGLPMCAYNIDAFKAWLAQNASNLAITGLSAVGGISRAVVGGALTGGLSGAVSGLASMGSIRPTLNALSQVYQASIRPPQANGEKGSIANVNLGIYDFFFYAKQIRKEFAKMIDSYFSMYGYATHQVKVPNISSRPHWNYVKTIGCVAVGSLPCDDMNKICSIYDKGVTFWKDGDEVGDYSLDNSPT